MVGPYWIHQATSNDNWNRRVIKNSFHLVQVIYLFLHNNEVKWWCKYEGFFHKRNGGQSTHPLNKGITYWKSVNLWDSPLRVRQHDVIFCVKTRGYFVDCGNVGTLRTWFPKMHWNLIGWSDGFFLFNDSWWYVTYSILIYQSSVGLMVIYHSSVTMRSYLMSISRKIIYHADDYELSRFENFNK